MDATPSQIIDSLISVREALVAIGVLERKKHEEHIARTIDGARCVLYVEGGCSPIRSTLVIRRSIVIGMLKLQFKSTPGAAGGLFGGVGHLDRATDS